MDSGDLLKCIEELIDEPDTKQYLNDSDNDSSGIAVDQPNALRLNEESSYPTFVPPPLSLGDIIQADDIQFIDYETHNQESRSGPFQDGATLHALMQEPILPDAYETIYATPDTGMHLNEYGVRNIPYRFTFGDVCDMIKVLNEGRCKVYNYANTEFEAIAKLTTNQRHIVLDHYENLERIVKRLESMGGAYMLHEYPRWMHMHGLMDNNETRTMYTCRRIDYFNHLSAGASLAVTNIIKDLGYE
jgi:hypothetical protein